MTIKEMRKQGLRLPARYRFLTNESGSVLMEFSLALIFLLTIVFGMMEICSATYTYTVLADAANEGVYYAIHNSSDQAGAVSTVQRYATESFHDVSKMSVSVTYPDGTASPPARVAVSISYQYVPYLSTFMTNPPSMHAYAEGRMVR